MPADSPLNSLDIEQAWDELRADLDFSREIVRQSRVLIELSESHPPFAAENDGEETAN